jgi:UDP-N-acetyl-2-amino-2-deoxyglucuronate dehydrogenase
VLIGSLTDEREKMTPKMDESTVGPPRNFALLGAAGYVAPRHMAAIRSTGNRLVAAADPHDAVGILDSHSFDVKFFTEIERFDRHIDKLRRGPESDRVHWVSICTPNYLHDAHIRLALRAGADALCEKPLVISPWNLDALAEIERETGKRVFTLLQLRVHPALVVLKAQLDAESKDVRHTVRLTYITCRGGWYRVSWKGSEDHSGGIATNIGIHFFDMLLWLFGAVESSEVNFRGPGRVGGLLRLGRADVQWFLSTEKEDLPYQPEPGSKTTFRSITVDGMEVDFTDGFVDLHTTVYERTLEGRGFGIEDSRPSIELAYNIGVLPVSSNPEEAHPLIAGLGGVGGAGDFP